MLLSFYIFLSLSITHAVAKQQINQQASGKNKVLCVTIPKSGTHLLLKCITLLEIEGIAYKYWEKPRGFHLHDLKDPIPLPLRKAMNKKNKAATKHLVYTPEAEAFIKDKTYANFFMIRDPRAQLVSQARTFHEHRIGGKKRSVEDIMLDIILARKENFMLSRRHLVNPNLPEHVIVAISDLFWLEGLHGFYSRFLPWMKAENFYTVRFEDLIGQSGGGSKDMQIQEIKNIAQHLGVQLSDKKLNEIVENLFGGTGTFREGQSASWKQYFTPRVMEAFKADSGLMQLLIDLGYEKDANW